MAATLPVSAAGPLATLFAPVVADLRGRPRRQGILLVLAASVMFAVMGALAKAASDAMPTMQLLAARCAVTWVAVELLRRRLHVPLVFHQWPALGARTLAGFFAMAAYFHALRFIPLGDAVLITHASPVLTSVAAVWLLRERMTPVRAAGLATAIVGVWLLVGTRPGEVAARGAWMAAASAVLSAVSGVALKVATRQNRALLIVWALAAVCTVSALAFWSREWAVPGARDVWLLAGTGLAAAAAQLASTMGWSRLEASEASLFGYATPPCAVLVGMVAFGEVPGAASLAGGALIVASGVGVAWLGRGRRI